MKGQVHLYTGNGKGKTTAAIGLAVRSVGAGHKVFFTQFLKSGDYSEIKALQDVDNIEIRQYGSGAFL
ncbi:MAG: cob(I)yrinic acid a,c-diamide adenosyltransferase, partial [Bacillota bacterium]